MIWQKYYELEPIRRLKNEGRELLGKPLVITEKRDGTNVSVWLDDAGVIQISSHNIQVASNDIIVRFQATKEYTKAVALLKDELQYNHHFILYGELLSEVGPTRIEPKRKHIQWILFDIYDIDEHCYLSYNMLYQKAYHFKIPVVRVVHFFIPVSMDDLADRVQQMLKWCKHHRREGAVGKCYETQVFFKEKIDLPKLPKLPKQPQIQYPPMPEEKILRALQHAYDEVGAENWKNVKITMPIVAKHFEVEAKEHNFATPRNMYQLWLNTPLERIVTDQKSSLGEKQ